MIEYIAESRRSPSSPGALDGDHWRKMPSKEGGSQHFDNPARAVVPRICRYVNPGYTHALEGMSQKKKLRLDIDSGAQSRRCQPRPPDPDGTWLIGTPWPGFRVEVGSTADGTIVGGPDLRKRSELARLSLLELVSDVLVDIRAVRDPRVSKAGAILLGGIRQVCGVGQ